MSDLSIVHGTVTILLRPVVDESQVNSAWSGDVLKYTRKVAYSQADFDQAVKQAQAALDAGAVIEA